MASVSLVVMLFIHFFFLILTSLLHYCNILFVALLATFSYEDKRLAQHWGTQLTHPLTVGIYAQNTHLCRMRTL